VEASVKLGSTTLLENTFDCKRIYANPSSYPNPNFNPNTSPNTNPNLNAQLCFRTDEITSFFDQVYRHRKAELKAKIGAKASRHQDHNIYLLLPLLITIIIECLMLEVLAE